MVQIIRVIEHKPKNKNGGGLGTRLLFMCMYKVHALWTYM